MRCIASFLFCLLGIGVEWAAAQAGGSDLSLAETENYDVRQDQYDVRQYNSENGLPQNSATGLLLDKNNFLWVATQNGLVRFDGRRFKLYDKSNTPAIKSNRFSVIGESSQREVLLGSSFDPAEIYKVGPDYKLVLDTARTRIAHKFIHINSPGFFDCTPLFKYYSNARNGVDTSLLHRLCLSPTFVVLNDNEVVVQDSRDEWYYLDNRSNTVNKLPVDIKGADIHVFFLKGILCIFSERGEWRFFQQGRPVSIQVDKTVSDLVRLAASTTGLKSILGPGGEQVIIRQQDDIYELVLDNGVLKAGLIFPDLKILDKLIATSFLYDKPNRRLFIATVTTGFIIVTKRPFSTIAFDTSDRLNNSFKAFLLLPGKRILTQNGVLNRTNAGNHRLFTSDTKPDGNCFYEAKDGSVWLSKDKHLHIYDRNFSTEGTMDSLPLDSYISASLKIAGIPSGSARSLHC
ncbi:MAG TPA: two-component regulator propeller domain-containing protein [Puia sp.]|uniref:two-component regulator propeller domain-containing protein n=1 Tax=Puia sp. TaxID=2045100 RepID=UPI002D001C6A|nr:two-component regulator propeller domain-containing protein [Puia sp.]HVU99575.1 two-component regulator propeller domain-containing protein [Puia sp.]